MSISGITTGSNALYASLQSNKDRQVTTNADGSKTLSVTSAGPDGGTIDKTLSQNADGGVTFELSRTTVNGTTTDKTVTTDGNGGYTGNFTLAGANGASASIQANGSVTDGTLEFNRALSYTLANGTTGTRTKEGSVGNGSVSQTIEGQATNTAGADYSRQSTLQGADGSGLSVQGKLGVTTADGNTHTHSFSDSTGPVPVATPDA